MTDKKPKPSEKEAEKKKAKKGEHGPVMFTKEEMEKE